MRSGYSVALQPFEKRAALNVTQFCLVRRLSVSIPVLSNSCKTGKNWNGNTLADVSPQPPMAVSARRPKCRPMRREPTERPLQQHRLHA